MQKKQKIKDNPNGSARLSGQRHGAFVETELLPVTYLGWFFETRTRFEIKIPC
jgi:hypothetical protein